MDQAAAIRRTIFAASAAVLLFFCLLAPAGGAEKFPTPAGAVNDFAGVIPEPYQQKMATLAQEVLEKTGTSVVVATFPTVGNNDPREYANRLYQAWGIGKKGEDKGVLIFLAVKERRVRIETGYGVEGILPDGLVGEILDREAIPYLRKGDYGRGLFNAMAAVSSVIARDARVTLGEGNAPSPEIQRREKAREKTGMPWTSSLTSLLVLILALGFLLGTRTGRSILPLILFMLLGGGGRGGGGFGGFGGGGFGGFGGGASGGGGADRGF